MASDVRERKLVYAETLRTIGALLDEHRLEFITLVEIDGELIARARYSGSRDFEQVIADQRAAAELALDGHYARMLSSIGRWLDSRGATDIVITEGEHYLAVGGQAPTPTGSDGYIMGPFEELLLPEEVDALLHASHS